MDLLIAVVGMQAIHVCNYSSGTFDSSVLSAEGSIIFASAASLGIADVS